MAEAEGRREDWAKFEKWMGDYHKVYKDANETEQRFKAFQETLRSIESQAHLPEFRQVYGFNGFSDLTNEDFQRDFLRLPVGYVPYDSDFDDQEESGEESSDDEEETGEKRPRDEENEKDTKEMENAFQRQGV